jgi:hypothetical protein
MEKADDGSMSQIRLGGGDEMGTLDVVTRRGKRKDAMVAFPQAFSPGHTVQFKRHIEKNSRAWGVPRSKASIFTTRS